MEVAFKLGGIEYKVEVDIDKDGIVSDIYNVSVWNAFTYQMLPLKKDDLKDFLKLYEDEIQEAWKEMKKDREIYYLSEKGKDK